MGARQPNKFILSVGNFYRHKNYEILFKAFTRLLEYDPDLYLVVVGDESDKVYYEQMVLYINALSVNERIYLPGLISHEQISHFYSNAECYTSTSILEAFPLTPFEAMSKGIPVVISNQTVFPEICGDAVVYFDPLDPDDVAEQIWSVLQDNGLAEQLIIKGFEQIKSFSWEKNAQQLKDQFLEELQ